MQWWIERQGELQCLKLSTKHARLVASKSRKATTSVVSSLLDKERIDLARLEVNLNICTHMCVIGEIINFVTLIAITSRFSGGFSWQNSRIFWQQNATVKIPEREWERRWLNVLMCEKNRRRWWAWVTEQQIVCWLAPLSRCVFVYVDSYQSSHIPIVLYILHFISLWGAPIDLSFMVNRGWCGGEEEELNYSLQHEL